MSEETPKEKGWLKQGFNITNKIIHYVHYAMLAGMTVAAAVGAAAMTGVPVNALNTAKALLDSTWQMIAGLADLPEFLSQLDLTDWSLDYEWGSAGHAHHASEDLPAGPVLSEAGRQLLGL